MRLSAEEKLEIIRMVTRSEIGVNRTLRELGIPKSTYFIAHFYFCLINLNLYKIISYKLSSRKKTS
jgi:hypothetical protein